MNELEKAQLAVEQANQAVLEASKTIQKLVAENAALKELSSYVGMRDDYINCERVVELRKGCPATDAAIAEINAQGVDKYAHEFSENANMDFACNRGFYHGALDFAANLRAGRKG